MASEVCPFFFCFSRLHDGPTIQCSFFTFLALFASFSFFFFFSFIFLLFYFFFLGCLLLLTPSKTEFDRLEEEVKSLSNSSSSGDSFVGPDERLITEHFFMDWIHVSSAYGCTAWKTDGLTPIILHYVSEKPWNSTKDWPDYKVWWDTAEEVIKTHGEDLRTFFKRPEKKQAISSDKRHTFSSPSSSSDKRHKFSSPSSSSTNSTTSTADTDKGDNSSTSTSTRNIRPRPDDE